MLAVPSMCPITLSQCCLLTNFLVTILAPNSSSDGLSLSSHVLYTDNLTKTPRTQSIIYLSITSTLSVSPTRPLHTPHKKSSLVCDSNIILIHHLTRYTSTPPYRSYVSQFTYSLLSCTTSAYYNPSSIPSVSFPRMPCTL